MESDRPTGGVAALAAVALASALFGLTGTVAVLAPESLTAVAAASWRALIGAACLVVVAVLRGQAPWRYPLPWRWVAVAAIGVAVNQPSFFEAVSRTGVAIGTLVTVATSPLVAGVIDWIVYGRRPGAVWLLGVAVAVGGVAMLSGGGQVVWSGVGFAVLAGAAFPLYGLAAQQLMRDRPMLPAMATVIAAGAVLLSPVAIATVDVAFESPRSVATIVFLGLATLTAAYVLLGSGLEQLSLSVVTAVTLLEPAVAAVLAVLVVGEPLSAGLVAGMVLILAGVGLASRTELPRRLRVLIRG